MENTLTQTDLQIKSMHSYLKNKVDGLYRLPETMQEAVGIVNLNTLQYFEITFKPDLQRLGLL